MSQTSSFGYRTLDNYKLFSLQKKKKKLTNCPAISSTSVGRLHQKLDLPRWLRIALTGAIKCQGLSHNILSFSQQD